MLSLPFSQNTLHPRPKLLDVERPTEQLLIDPSIAKQRAREQVVLMVAVQHHWEPLTQMMGGSKRLSNRKQLAFEGMPSLFCFGETAVVDRTNFVSPTFAVPLG